MATFDALAVGRRAAPRRCRRSTGRCARRRSRSTRTTSSATPARQRRRHRDVGMRRRPSWPRSPANACTLFGPDPPPQMAGQPPLRPARSRHHRRLLPAAARRRRQRHRRSRSSASPARWPTPDRLAAQFAQTYVPNNNPTLEPIDARPSAAPRVTLDALPAGKCRSTSRSAGRRQRRELSRCSTRPPGIARCTMRESMRVSWFATAGAFATTSPAATRPTRHRTDNVWTAPATPGPVHLWLVLRDSRGGIDYAAYELTVTP